jgi:mycothiol synthase
MISERPATAADVDQVLELYCAYDLAVRGFIDCDADDVTAEWEAPGFDFALHSKVVHDGDLLLGYAVVDPTGSADSVTVLGAAGVEPLQRLLAWLATLPGPLLHYLPAGETATAALFEERGWTRDRLFWRMRIDLPDPVEPGTWPAGVEVRGMDAVDDAEHVHALITQAFGDIGDDRALRTLEDWRAHMLGSKFDPDLYLVAHQDGELVGASLCQDLSDYALVPQLAVRRDQRGRGLAGALLRETFHRVQARGLPQCQLGVDSANATGAVRLYESVGMRISEEFVRWRLG